MVKRIFFLKIRFKKNGKKKVLKDLGGCII